MVEKAFLTRIVKTWHSVVNPLLSMPVLGFSNSAANKDMSKIWANGKIVTSNSAANKDMSEIWVNGKIVTSNFSFSHNVFKSCLLLMHQNEFL